MTVTLVVLGAVLLLLAISVIVMYNRFISQITLVEESWSQVDVELTRRWDLIPNLVETVKGYAAHERETLRQLTEARATAQQHDKDGPVERQRYESALSGALDRALVVAEAYPDLKASRNFLALQEELATTEDRIAAARRFYNGNVRALNTRVRTFPSNLIAAMFSFRARDFFELADPRARAAVQVEL